MDAIGALLSRRQQSAEIIGASPPPPGVTANFVNGEWNGLKLDVICIVFLILTNIVVALRIYTRWAIVKSMGPDDYAVVISQIINWPFTILVLIQNRIGGGHHIWDIPFTEFSPRYLLLFTIEQPIYTIAILFAKLSVLCFYLRISPQQSFRIAVFTMMAIVIGAYVPTSFISILSCNPAAQTWDLTVTGGKCINKPVFYIATASINVATDVLMLLLPWPMVWNLQMPRRQKIGLVFIFLTGSFITIVSIIRLTHIFAFLTTTDLTWLATTTQIWTVLEVHCAIICACMPCAKPLLRRHLPMLVGDSAAAESGPSGYSSQRSQSSTNKIPRTRTTAVNEEDLELYEGGKSETVVSSREVHPTNPKRYTDGSRRLDEEDAPDNIYKETQVHVDYWEVDGGKGVGEHGEVELRHDNQSDVSAQHHGSAVKGRENI
ncbi:MAG: hypothetical protein M1817_002603 [Caeruleum heppii]|nr:MAG: hypothetical protein M1817_002603 [Caeruleum heppii]